MLVLDHDSIAFTQDGSFGRFMKKRLTWATLLIVLLVFGFGFPASSAKESAARRIEITAQRFSFDPAAITVKKGEPVILVLKSNDVPHGLRFPDIGLELKAPKGGSVEAQFTPEKTGDFIGHCSVFCGAGHGSMTLTMHVVD